MKAACSLAEQNSYRLAPGRQCIKAQTCFPRKAQKFVVDTWLPGCVAESDTIREPSSSSSDFRRQTNEDDDFHHQDWYDRVRSLITDDDPPHQRLSLCYDESN